LYLTGAAGGVVADTAIASGAVASPECDCGSSVYHEVNAVNLAQPYSYSSTPVRPDGEDVTLQVTVRNAAGGDIPRGTTFTVFVLSNAQAFVDTAAPYTGSAHAVFKWAVTSLTRS